MKLYLSGPMTGMPEGNRSAFLEAATALRKKGHEVVNPGELDANDPEAKGKPRAYFMRRDIPLLCSCEAVAALPGWEDSVGAHLEILVARAMGLPILNALTMEPVSAESILDEAWRAVHGARRKDYGHPKENHARTAALWSAYLGIPLTPVQVCMLNILQKVARSMHRVTRDDLVDIAGYSENVDLVR